MRGITTSLLTIALALTAYGCGGSSGGGGGSAPAGAPPSAPSPVPPSGGTSGSSDGGSGSGNTSSAGDTPLADATRSAGGTGASSDTSASGGGTPSGGAAGGPQPSDAGSPLPPTTNDPGGQGTGTSSGGAAAPAPSPTPPRGQRAPVAPLPIPVDHQLFTADEWVVLRGSVYDPNAEPVATRWYLGGTLLEQSTVSTLTSEAVVVPSLSLEPGRLPIGSHTLALEAADARSAGVAGFSLEVVPAGAALSAIDLQLSHLSPRLAPLLALAGPALDTRVTDRLDVSVEFAGYTFSQTGQTFTFDGQAVAGHNVGAVGDVVVYAGSTRLGETRAPAGVKQGTLTLDGLDVSALPEGRHVLTVVIYQGDEHSRIGRLARTAIVVDRSGPAVGIVTPYDGAFVDEAAGVVSVTGTARDGAGVRVVSVNGVAAQDTAGDGSFATWAATVPFTRPAGTSGLFPLTLTAVAEDELGNQASAALDVRVGRATLAYAGAELPIDGQSVVYVLDRSGSMGWSLMSYLALDGTTRYGTKFDAARASIGRSLQALPVGFSFEILAFDHGLQSWSGALQPVTAANVAAAIAWLDGLRVGGATSTGPAVTHALEQYAENRSLLLVSDGLPNHPGSASSHRSMISRANVQGATIHTVGISTSGSGEAFMRAIAQDSGGTFFSGTEGGSATTSYAGTGGSSGGGPLAPPGPTDDHGETPATATGLAVGSSVLGRLERGSDEDWFRVDLTAGRRYLFSHGPSWASGVIALHDELGVRVSAGEVIAHRASVSGPVYVVLSAACGATDYQVYAALDDHGPLGEATPGAPEEALEGVLDAPRDQDAFSLSLTPGERYEVAFSGAFSASNVIVALTDASGARVADLSSWGPPATLRATGSGAYSLHAYGIWRGQPTPYSLRVRRIQDEHPDEPALATPVDLGARIAAALQVADDHDWVQVHLEAGRRYVVSLTTRARAQLEVCVIDPNGAGSGRFQIGYGGGTGAMILAPDVTGAHAFRVRAPWSAGGVIDYELVVAEVDADDHGDERALATAVRVGVPVRGRLEVPRDPDWFAVPLLAGTRYTLALVTSATLTGLTIARPDGREVLVAAGYTRPEFGIAPELDGTYFVKVEGGASEALTDYTLEVRVAADDHDDAPAGATPLRLKEQVTGRIEAPPDRDVFAIELEAGVTYRAIVSDADDQRTNARFSRVIAPDGGTSSAATWTAAATGRYAVVVGDRDPDGEASAVAPYVLRVLRTSPQLVEAALRDEDGSGTATAGDQLVLTFDLPVRRWLSSSDPATYLELPTAGDRLGAGARIEPLDTHQLQVTLGQDPLLRVTGAFDPQRLSVGEPSGIALVPLNRLGAQGENAFVPGGALDLTGPMAPALTAAPSLVTPRGGHTATLLADGRVLVVGGLTDGGRFAYEAELHDAGAWTDTSHPSLGGRAGRLEVTGGDGLPYVTGRVDHTATRLQDGRVLIAGGWAFEGALDAAGAPLLGVARSAFVFDPQACTFTQVGSLAEGRQRHVASLLPDGRVLLAGGLGVGGDSLASAEVFDPARGRFSPAAALLGARHDASAALLADGTLLVAGGQRWIDGRRDPGLGSERFDPTAGTWRAGPALTPDRWHAGAQAVDGRLVLTGGAAAAGTLAEVTQLDGSGPSANLLDALAEPRERHALASSGSLLVAIGGVRQSGSGPLPVASLELFQVGSAPQVLPLTCERVGHTATTLAPGQVLVVGGWVGGVARNGRDGVPTAGCDLLTLP